VDRLARVVLARHRPPRVERGHPWVYRTEIARVEGEPSPGATVEVADADGRRLGYGYLNPASMIAVRLIARGDEPPGPDLWRERIARARARRERLMPGTVAYRAVNAEGDDLPGLVVDRFGDHLVVESLSLGVEVRLEEIVAALREVYAPNSIYLRADAAVRRLEGLDQDSRPLYGGEPPELVRIEEEGVVYDVDIRAGQKTGHFFDQRLNRRDAGALLGGEVLDAFCHTGGFGLQALRQGAERVVFVDTSAAALERARANVRLNGFEGRAEFVEENAFDLLRRWAREGRRFDGVVLDPPAFAKAKSAVEAALRGYNEINLRAIRLLRTGGHLVSASCSQPVDREAFLGVIAHAAGDDRRAMRLIALRGAAPDHPALIAQPQGDYLKCAFLEAGEGWSGHA
jgi:23S rRNA (cytosine1962-C5)-methyltransferase